MWRVHEIASSATSKQLVVHALPADALRRRGGNLSDSCTQFVLVTVIQLLREEGVNLTTDASAIASGKPPEVALDADNLDLLNVPATFEYEGNKKSWQQGLPPGEVGTHNEMNFSLRLEATNDNQGEAQCLQQCSDKRTNPSTYF